MLNNTSRAHLRRILVPVAAAAVVGVASLTGAGAASAHVTANSATVTQGGYGIVNFVVPNEEDVPTVSLRVSVPNLAGVRTEPMPGWKSQIIKDPATEEVTAVVWTADPGQGIPVGQFEEFRIQGGPFPEQETVALPAVQTYANGVTVDWSQPENADGSEPEHPAPTLTLAPSNGDHHGGAHGANDQADAQSDSSTSDTAARWLGGVGLLLGAIGAVVGVAALSRRGKKSGGSDDA
ncbi:MULTISPECIES: DUF1775 domain-containing protein [unclassified Gordonia (in: high G+C Gram-positive bacteria)]|uniref:YcnI family copper-binding membrane protein n=1 Tax=Gordonia sp. B7-2 TaxID=3420932 RepID=UPI003D93B35C